MKKSVLVLETRGGVININGPLTETKSVVPFDITNIEYRRVPIALFFLVGTCRGKYSSLVRLVSISS